MIVFSNSCDILLFNICRLPLTTFYFLAFRHFVFCCDLLATAASNNRLCRCEFVCVYRLYTLTTLFTYNIKAYYKFEYMLNIYFKKMSVCTRVLSILFVEPEDCVPVFCVVSMLCQRSAYPGSA